MVNENQQILWQRFHSLDSNHPKFYTRCYQLVKTIYMVNNDQEVVEELDKLYYDYPPFHVPISYLEDAFYASIGGSMATNIKIDALKANVMDINMHLNIFYGFLLYLATVALFDETPSWGIDFSGETMKAKPKKKQEKK